MAGTLGPSRGCLLCVTGIELFGRVSGLRGKVGQGGNSGKCQGRENSVSKVDRRCQSWCPPALGQLGS